VIPAWSADIIVLTINAAKVAARKENVADPMRAANRWLFSPVNAY
jgi:hypothetical protein